MDNNTIIGYNILAKRAIETESGVNIDEALKKITAYRVVRGEGEDRHPASDVTVSTKILYFTKSDDDYIGWIWVDGEGWVCAGGASDSWKSWSEKHGCTATGELSVYIGMNNEADGDFSSFQIGHDNVVDGEVNEYVEPEEIVSVNIGAQNTVHGEGVNLGKKNTTGNFGINIGQRNTSHDFGISMGQDLNVENGGVGIGRSSTIYPGAIGIGDSLSVQNGSIALGKGMTVSTGSLALGENYGCQVWSGAVLVGANNTGVIDGGTSVLGRGNQLGPSDGNSGYCYGSTVVGRENRLASSSNGAYGSVVFGNRNTIADSGNMSAGGIAVGIYNHVKGSGGAAFGQGGTAKYGTVLSTKGTDSYNTGAGAYAESALAIGGNRIAAYYGAVVIGDNSCMGYSNGYVFGWNTATAQFGGFSIGYNGIYSYNSINIGWNSGAALFGSIALGWNSRLAMSNSLAIGFDNCTAEYYSLAFGKNSVFAYSNSMVFGFNQVKGVNNSIAIGMNSVLAYDNSMAIGNGAYASNTALCIFDPSTKPINCFTTQDKRIFSYYDKDNNSGYVEVKFSGVTKQGDVYYSEVTGQTYSSVTSIPWSAYKVKIRGTKDEDGVIHPFYGLDINIDRSEIEDSWVDVEWASSGTSWYGLSSSSIYGPQDLYVNSAYANGTVIGGAGHARYGSLAICPNMSHYSGSFTISLETDYNSIPTQSYARSNYASGTYTESYRFHEAIAESDSIAIGVGTWAKYGSTALGTMVKAESASLALGYGSIGDKYIGTSYGNSLLISGVGYYSDGPSRGFSKDKSVAIGTAPKADDQAVSIGDCTIANRKSIALGAYSRANDASIAIGDDNESKGNAIGIGTMNLSAGWSIALGVHNTSYDGPGGHTTMIGQFNTSTSNQETIHKVFHIYVDGDGKITQEQINELSGRESAYRRLLDPYLDSEMIAYLNTADAGNNDYYLGRADEMAWGYYSYFAWLQQLGNQPLFIFTEADKAALYEIMQQQPQTLEESKTLMLQVCDIVQNYANVNELRTSINAATTMTDLNTIFMSSWLWQGIVRSLQWSGDPIPGVVSDFNAFQQILDAYSNWNNYGLSLRSSITPHYETIEDDFVCNSFLVGNNNTSNHYNSILIGALNESQTPLVQPDAIYHTTDDDGFMIAVGYRNVVGRNYDIAIGHKSKAIGGENVALQHSEAKGYRNFAAFDSSIEGTGNISVMESNANITLSESAEAVTSSVLHNTLLNTKVNIDGNNWYSSSTGTYVVLKNIMTNCKLDGNMYDDPQSKACGLYAYSVGYNIMSNIYRGRIDSYSIWDNVLIGNDTQNSASYDYEYSRYDVNNTQSFSRNFIFRPRGGSQNYSTGETFNGGIQITDTLAFDENVLFLSSIDIPKPTGEVGYYLDRYVSNNFLMHSRLIGNPKAVVDNVLFGNSILSADYVRTNTGTTAISNNFLLNSHLRATAYGHRDNTKRGILNTNFLIGTDAVDIEATFSFNDRGTKSGVPGYFLLQRTFRCANFGDNDMSFANDTFVQGSENSITALTHSSIFGNRNTVSGTEDYLQYIDEQDYLGNGINALHVMGDDNYVFYKRRETQSYWDYLARTCIFGANNTVIGDALGANTIIGDDNDIDDYYPLLTENELIANQNQLATTSYYSLSENAVAYSLTNGQKTPITTNRQISTNTFVSGDRIASEYSSTATEIQWSEFASRYNNGTLAKGYYRITDTINVTLLTATLYEGRYQPYHTVITMENGVVTRHSDDAPNRSAAHGTTKNILIGSHNRIRSQIHAYALIGSDNEVLNTHAASTENQYNLKYGIGNGFLQGNNNYAEDGSNIILMGNGNTGYGHNAVAIGCQLEARHWQTVIGKYNQPVDGPDRLTSADDPSQSNKALFIVGNGYSTKDDFRDWQNEQFITRSNAMVVYANGDTVFSGNVNAANLPPAPSNDGRYALNCIVTNGVPSYSWVPVGTVTV